jgi:hypothetical protein
VAKHQSSALPGVVARDLDPETRRKVWEHIKATQPALAETLSTDAFIAAAREKLGASPVFSGALVREAKRT